MNAQKQTAVTTKSQKIHIPNDATSLIKWELTEEKRKHSKDKELIILLVGAAAVILAILANTYVFGALLATATGVFVYNGRQKPKKLMFNITDMGIFLENDFLSLDEVTGFNVIDDPGARARLLLKVEKIITMNEIVPIYDVDIEEIEDALEKLNIQKDETLRPTMLDNLNLLI